MPLNVDRLDHLVLTVASIEASCDFYSRVLGMQIIEFPGQDDAVDMPLRRALRFGDQKINLHEQGKEIAPSANSATPGSADLCLITSRSTDDIMLHLQQAHVPVELGPVTRSGALGPVTSVYFRDPDGNLLELATYD